MSRNDFTRADPLYDTEATSHRLKSEASDARPSPRTLERWRTTGQGPAFIKVGRRVFYAESSIATWLGRQTRSHTNDDGGRT